MQVEFYSEMFGREDDIQEELVKRLIDTYKERLEWGYFVIYEMSLICLYYQDWVKNLMGLYKSWYYSKPDSATKALITMEQFLVLNKSGTEVLGSGVASRENTNEWVTFTSGDMIHRVDLVDVHIVPVASMYSAYRSLYEYLNDNEDLFKITLKSGHEALISSMEIFNKDDVLKGNVTLVDAFGDRRSVNILSINKVIKYQEGN